MSGANAAVVGIKRGTLPSRLNECGCRSLRIRVGVDMLCTAHGLENLTLVIVVVATVGGFLINLAERCCAIGQWISIFSFKTITEHVWTPRSLKYFLNGAASCNIHRCYEAVEAGFDCFFLDGPTGPSH